MPDKDKQNNSTINQDQDVTGNKDTIAQPESTYPRGELPYYQHIDEVGIFTKDSTQTTIDVKENNEQPSTNTTEANKEPTVNPIKKTKNSNISGRHVQRIGKTEKENELGFTSSTPVLHVMQLPVVGKEGNGYILPSGSGYLVVNGVFKKIK